ncbi:MAG: FtsX-like permease family protein, partial [Ginsengibacter sp.]
FQYIVESFVVAFVALALAFIFLPIVQQGYHFTTKIIVIAGVFTGITAVCAGGFPAWILSSFKPVLVLKNFSTQKLFGNISLQKGLMVFQFSISILVIIFLTVYYQQFHYLQNVNTGFASANIITLPATANDEFFLNEVQRINGVEDVSRMSDDFGIRGTGFTPVFLDKPVNQQGLIAEYYFADAGAIPVHQLKIIAGTNFNDDEIAGPEKYVLINEKAVRVLGFKKPLNAINKTIWLNDSTQVAIKGVLADFYDKGAARNINPLLLRNKQDAFNYINILVNEKSKTNALRQVAAAWKNLHPHTPFEYQWLDMKIADRDDQGETYSTMGFIALIVITIASLGLLGLVIYTVETRQKEISIRKIIGAEVSQLMYMLSKSFVKLIVIAGLVALPVAYILSFMFLQNFPTRIIVGPGILLSGFLFLLLIGLMTILWNTYKASIINPIQNLRAE